MKNGIHLEKVGEQISLTDRVYHILRQAILSLDLKPGSLLVEETIALQLGVSKTPVRGAFHKLSQEGLVIRKPYKGVYVSEISFEQMEEIFEVRAVLEGLAARLAARHFPETDFEKAEECLSRAEKALEAGEAEACAQAGKEFHNLVISHIDNEYLMTVLLNVEAHLQRYRIYTAQIPGRLSKSIREHREVLDAIKQRDPVLAEEALKYHLLGMVKEIREFESRQSIDDLEQG